MTAHGESVVCCLKYEHAKGMYFINVFRNSSFSFFNIKYNDWYFASINSVKSDIAGGNEVRTLLSSFFLLNI